MTKVSDIYNYLCRMAPLQLQMDFDNSGLLLGRLEREVNKVILTLDITSDVIAEAINKVSAQRASLGAIQNRLGEEMNTYEPSSKKAIEAARANQELLRSQEGMDI